METPSTKDLLRDNEAMTAIREKDCCRKQAWSTTGGSASVHRRAEAENSHHQQQRKGAKQHCLPAIYHQPPFYTAGRL
jgi:hypothetical protein